MLTVKSAGTGCSSCGYMGAEKETDNRQEKILCESLTQFIDAFILICTAWHLNTVSIGRPLGAPVINTAGKSVRPGFREAVAEKENHATATRYLPCKLP